MDSQVITSKLRILAPDDGMALTDGTTYTTGTVFLAWNADASKWREVPESEIQEQESSAPPPRTFSKLRIVAALSKAGVWDAVKQLLIERGYYDLFLAAQDFRDDNEDFKNGKTALQTALGWTDEQVEAVLAASVRA